MGSYEEIAKLLTFHVSKLKDETGMTSAQIAPLLGVSPSALSMMMAGRRKVSAIVNQKMAETFALDANEIKIKDLLFELQYTEAGTEEHIRSNISSLISRHSVEESLDSYDWVAF